MKLLKNVTFALGLSTMFGSQYAADIEVEPTPMEVVEVSAATATAEQTYKLICAGQEFVVSKAFVESCQTLKDCIEYSDDESAISIAIAKPEALVQLIEIFESIRLQPEASNPEKMAKLCAEIIDPLEQEQFLNLIEIAEYLNLRSHLYTAILDRAYREFKEQTSQIRKAKHILSLSPATALNMLAKLATDNPSFIQATILKSGPKTTIQQACWSPDGSKIASTHAITPQVDVWDVRHNKLLYSITGHDKYINATKWSPDGSKIITTSLDKNAKIWNADNGELLHTLSGHTDLVISAEWSHDSNKVVTISYDKNTKIWNARTGELLFNVTFDLFINTASWSSNDSMIVISFHNGTSTILHAETGQLLLTLSKHKDCVGSASWSHDDSMIVTASGDNKAKIWNAKTGSLIRTLKGHKDYLGSASWSHDDSMIVTASGDKKAKIWDAKTGDLIRTLKGHKSPLSWASWSPDSSKIITSAACETGIWNAKTGELMARVKGHQKHYSTANWSPDGSGVAIPSTEATGIWRLKSAGDFYKEYEEINAAADKIKPYLNMIVGRQIRLYLAMAEKIMTEKIKKRAHDADDKYEDDERPVQRSKK